LLATLAKGREIGGSSHGRSANRPYLRLVVHRHIRNEYPGAAALFIHGLHASWSDLHFVPGATSTTSLKLGAVLEFGLIVTQIGTAVVIYPLVRRQSETVSLGYVAARIMESVFAAIGIMSILTIVNVAGSLALATGAQATALGVSGNSLAHTYEWAFEWGPGLVAGIRERLDAGLLDVPIGTRAASHGVAWTHRWLLVDT